MILFEYTSYPMILFEHASDPMILFECTSYPMILFEIRDNSIAAINNMRDPSETINMNFGKFGTVGYPDTFP